MHHESKKYDGFRLTYMGYDYLALRAMVARGTIAGIGRQIGIGKESDIFLATGPNGEKLALKLHRLGRISFRNIKEVRRARGVLLPLVQLLSPSPARHPRARAHRNEITCSTERTPRGCFSLGWLRSRSSRS